MAEKPNKLKREQITPELVRKVLKYDPKTGKLEWRPRPDDPWFTSRYGGKPALTSVAWGYHHGTIYAVIVKAHRVAWCHYYGRWPKNHIDHINGIRSDNRIENLRDVSRRRNSKNRSLSSNNTSGVNGVSWSARRKGWIAQIRVNRKSIFLGAFKEKSEAIAARKNADREFNFHPNHGAPLPEGVKYDM